MVNQLTIINYPYINFIQQNITRYIKITIVEQVLNNKYNKQPKTMLNKYKIANKNGHRVNHAVAAKLLRDDGRYDGFSQR